MRGEFIMENKTVGIIATIATALCCGCPGLLALCFGVTSAFAGIVPGADIDVFGSNDPSSAIGFGLAALCLGVIFIAIPVAVGFFTLRGKPAASSAETVPVSDEPIPPPN